MLKLSEIDEALLLYADTLSPEAISFKIQGALTPSQVERRIRQLLTSPDWLEAAEQDQLVTMRMRLLIRKMDSLPFTTRTAEVLGQQLERLGNRLEKRTKATEADLSQLYAFQGRVLFDAVDVALNHIRKSLASDIDSATWDNAIESGLRLAQIELAKHEPGVNADELLEPQYPDPDALPKNFESTKSLAPVVDPENRKAVTS